MEREAPIEQVTAMGRLDAAVARRGVPHPAARPRPQPRAKPVHAGKLAAARVAVRDVLAAECHPREIRITKIAPEHDGGSGWQAEAEMLVPDLGIKTLGLPLSQAVLCREYCILSLDAQLAVESYELLDPRDR